MKMRVTFIIILSILFISCRPRHKGEIKTGLLSNFFEITDNEDKGIKEIISFYGGQCDYGIRISTASKKPTFWLKFSKSKSIDSLAKMAELPCSNIAYLFYKNLDGEKTKYEKIESELIFGDGGSLKYNYSISQLEKVKTKIKLVDKIVSLIKDKKFNDIKAYLVVDTSLYNYSQDKQVRNLEYCEPEFGNAKQFIPYGFTFLRTNNGKEILHISGLIVRDKKSNYFSANLDPDSTLDMIYLLNYEL